jgi:hypothetical protein
MNRKAAAYWITRWSLSSGSPEGKTRWPGIATLLHSAAGVYRYWQRHVAGWRNAPLGSPN